MSPICRHRRRRKPADMRSPEEWRGGLRLMSSWKRICPSKKLPPGRVADREGGNGFPLERVADGTVDTLGCQAGAAFQGVPDAGAPAAAEGGADSCADAQGRASLVDAACRPGPQIAADRALGIDAAEVLCHGHRDSGC